MSPVDTFRQTELTQLREGRVADVVGNAGYFGPLELPEVAKLLLNFWRQRWKLLLLLLLLRIRQLGMRLLVGGGGGDALVSPLRDLVPEVLSTRDAGIRHDARVNSPG